MSRQVIEAAGTRDDRLLGREPAMRLDARGDLLSGLDLGCLHVDGADAELPVAEAILRSAASCRARSDSRRTRFADEIGLVAAGSK